MGCSGVLATVRSLIMTIVGDGPGPSVTGDTRLSPEAPSARATSWCYLASLRGLRDSERKGESDDF